MTDLELLFLVLAIIYTWECAWWAKRDAVGFRTWLGLRWKAVHPGRLLGNQRGGLVFAQPLPPLGTLLTSNSWPLSVSSEAVLAYVPPAIDPANRVPQTEALVRFDQIQTIEARGKKVCVNGQVLLKAGSATLAEHIANTLQALWQKTIAERSGAIEKLIENTFDTKAARERWDLFRKESAGLRIAANVLFVYLFLVAPALVWYLGLSAAWKPVLGALLICTSTTAFLFRRAHTRLYPGAEDERFTNFLIVLLSPASSIRAADLLSRPLLERFHPLATARLFCNERAFTGLAQAVLRELRYPALPLCPRPEPAAQAAERYARELALTSLERLLKRDSLQPDDLLRPPAQQDPTCRSYCPRCHAQFTAVGGSCHDCGGIELTAFSPRQPATP